MIIRPPKEKLEVFQELMDLFDEWGIKFMNGIMEKVSGLAIIATLVLLFVLNVILPFRENQKVLLGANQTMITLLESEIKKIHKESGITTSP